MYLLYQVFKSNDRSSSNSGRVNSTGVSLLTLSYTFLDAFLALVLAHSLMDNICSFIVTASGTVFLITSIINLVVNFGFSGFDIIAVR